MRSIWKGTISFGLVSIPIKLYSAQEEKSIGFHMLCNKCRSRLSYKRVCEGCGKEVQWEDTVKGLEISKGQYLTFTKEELDKIKPEKSDRVDITEFVDLAEIDPIYYNKSYFCAPQKATDRAYFLIKEVLKTTNKVAIGKFVMREKEYICMIRAFEKGLLLTTLHYVYEIRDINKLDELNAEPKLSKEETKLAVALVDQLYKEELDMASFTDTYADQLRKMIKSKDKVEVKKGKKKESRPADLMEALKASLHK